MKPLNKPSVSRPYVTGITLTLANARYEDENGMFPKGRGRFQTCPYGPHHAYFHGNGSHSGGGMNWTPIVR